MDFGKRMMTKAWARVRAFFVPRRSRVVNSGEEEGLRNPSFSRRRRIAGSAGAPRARHPRHNENDPVFDKIRQIHGLIPQIHAFFRQIQDPSEREKKYQITENKRVMRKSGAGRGYFTRPRAFARICACAGSAASWQDSFASGETARSGARQVFRRARRGVIMTMKSETSFAAYLRGWSFAVIPAEAGIQGWIVSPHRVGRRLCGFR